MASGAQPAFAPRNTSLYGKLPDRTTNTNPPPFSGSVSRRDGQNPPAPPPHSQGQQGGPGGQARQEMQQQQQRDPMAELSEEQREEINEAVCIAPSVCLYALEVQERLPAVTRSRPCDASGDCRPESTSSHIPKLIELNSSPSSTSTATAT
jgi:hypothetical protein